MSQIFPLDRIIKRVETPDPPVENARGERLVIVDARRGRECVLDEKPFWTLGRDLRYFIVSAAGSAECLGPTCSVRDLPTGRTIEVAIRYEARCASGGERALALELGCHDNPQLHLNRLLETWAQELLREQKREGEDVIAGFPRVKPLLERRLMDRARPIGLDLEVVTGIKGEDELKTVQVHSVPFSVKLSDSDSDVLIRLQAELDVRPEQRIEAVLRRGKISELESKVRERTQAFMVEQVTLNDVYFDLKDGVRSRLKEVLDEMLAREGRSVTHLVLEAVGLEDVDRNLTIEYPVSCKIKDPAEKVLLNNTLLLTLDDLGRWRLSRFSTLDEWCDRVLAPIAREEMFDLSYLDLLLDFSSTEAKIKGLVNRKAAEVGYSVHHHVVLPDLPPLELPKGFRVELEDELPTLDSRIEVGLQVVIDGKIPDLRKIEYLLSPRVDVLREMKRVVLDEIKRVMHGVHPERFYMRFEHSDVADESPVEEEIREAIRQKVVEAFAVEKPTIVLKRKETPLTKRATDLCKGHHSFQLVCAPLRSGGGEEVIPFVVFFEVLGVRDWFTFYSKGYQSVDEEVDAIKEILSEELKSKLEMVPQQQLQYRDIEDKSILARHVFTRAVEKVCEVFGLVVRILVVRRLPSPREQVLLNVQKSYAEQYELAEKAGLEQKLSFRRGEYGRLVDKLAKLQESDVEWDDPEILGLREQILALESEITQKPAEFGPKLITEARGELSDGVAWGAFDEEPAIISSGEAPSCDGAEAGDE